jgi:hypothetical protein
VAELHDFRRLSARQSWLISASFPPRSDGMRESRSITKWHSTSAGFSRRPGIIACSRHGSAQRRREGQPVRIRPGRSSPGRSAPVPRPSEAPSTPR